MPDVVKETCYFCDASDHLLYITIEDTWVCEDCYEREVHTCKKCHLESFDAECEECK